MKNKARENRRNFLVEFLFFTLPAIAVGSWILFIGFKPPKQPIFSKYNSNSLLNFSQISDDIIPKVIKIKARRFVNSKEEEFEREINLSDTVAYVDMWRSHWCTYYNDREFFFTPRINEMLQRLRQFNVPVVTISQLAEQDYSFTGQRRKGRSLIYKGYSDVLEKYEAAQMRYHPEYIPKFKDICVYKDLTRYGPTRDNKLTEKIAIAKDDILVQNFRESAEAFVGTGKKTVIVFGQHTNMCLMAVFLYCKQVNLDLIIVRDLVDACWVFELEKSYANSHTKGNNITNIYFDTKFGSSIISYDLIRSLNRLKRVKKTTPTYEFFQKTAFMFKHLFE